MATSDELKQRLANAQSSAEPLKNNVDRLESEASALTDQLSSLEEANEQIADNIAVAESAASRATDPAQVAALKNRVFELNDRLQEGLKQEREVKSQEREINQQAAQARTRLRLVEGQISELEQGIQEAESRESADLQTEKEQDEEQAADPASTIKSPEATNDSESDQETEEKYADPTNTPDEDPFERSRQDAEDEYNASFSNDLTKDLTDASDEDTVKESRSGVPKGAETGNQTPRASAEWAETKDLRVILRVPKAYLKGPAAGPSNILNDFGGILFPYTPTISYDNQAQYGAVNPVHSNYTQYFFKNSQVGQISISAKFTVQNEREGKVWLGVIHLLRALTKMRWGKDVGAGSPPPVCRLEGYGDFMLRNVPVVISSFKFDLPDNVDYISVGGEYKNTLVPSITTINLGLNVMYSRREMQDFSVDSWIQGNLRGQGYL
jgi:predicted  nucleic acid-binding Zn-ribbon protein